MADQHNDNIPAVGNNIADDIPDIKENLEFHKDVFQNFCTTWSNTVATGIFPCKWARVAKTADYTMTATDNIIEVDASGAAVTITLLAAATAGAGRYIFIKVTDATNDVTVDGNGAETIDGSATLTISNDNECVILYCDGTNWQIFCRYSYGQVAFPATQAASAGANTLDDYEEGTWTPDVQFGGAKVGITYSSQIGYYTKVGRLVTVNAQIVLTSKGTSVGAVTIAGLPFTVAGAKSSASVWTYKVSFSAQMIAYVASTEVQIDETTEAGVITSLSNADFSDDSIIYLSASYNV